MVFGKSCFSLLHETTGTKLYFDAFGALEGWKQEALPPVEVPAAEKWKCRRYIFFFKIFIQYFGTFLSWFILN